MDNGDRNTFNLVQQLSETDMVKLLQQMDSEEEHITDLDKQRMKANVMGQVNRQKKKSSLKKLVYIACIFVTILMTALTPMGKHILAEVGAKLYLIPGIGKVVGRENTDVYVLKRSIIHIENEQETTIKSIVKEGGKIQVRMEGTGSLTEDIKLLDKSGVWYASSNSWRAFGHGWIASYGFDNIPEDLHEFSIVLSESTEIPITLIKAESYEDYRDMGPTHVKNDLGLTLVPSVAGDLIRFDMIEHADPSRKVTLYGHIDKAGKNNIDISVTDEKGREYPLNYAKSYDGTLSEFYFQPGSDIRKYFVQIPEVRLSYPIDHKVTIPIPSDGEVEIGQSLNINGLTLDIVKAVRQGDKLIVDVNPNYDSAQPENINLLYLDIVSKKNFSYSWQFDDNLAVIRYEFDINPNEKSITIRFKELLTKLKGPWSFEITP